MNPIDGSTPVGGSQPIEKAPNSLEPPIKLSMNESETPATGTPNASQVLGNLTSLNTNEGRNFLGGTIAEAFRGTQNEK